MIAVLEAILPVVARSSGLALELYRVAALSQDEAAKDLIKAASAINSFATILKQIGTVIKEDDRLLSQEAIEILEDLIEQSQSISSEIDSLATFAAGGHRGEDGARLEKTRPSRLDPNQATRLAYLTDHLEALRATLSVLLQTLYTAQLIILSRYGPTITPAQAERSIENERLQLEALITEQQVLILAATSTYEHASLSQSLLLMEADSSQSLVAAKREEVPSPAKLSQYQSLDRTSSNSSNWLMPIRNNITSQIELLLKRWTCLPKLDSRLRDAERELRTQQRQSQQPMVESDSEDEEDQSQKDAGADDWTTQPLVTEPKSLPNQVQDMKYGPTAPLSPAASPRTSRDSLDAPLSGHGPPISPRSSLTGPPVEATAAIEAKEEDEDIDLEIPWRLCTRNYYWRYIDGKIVGSNTDQLPSVAFLERNSWTEIMASWVCKEAIREAGFRVTQAQKETKDGRRTKFETCFFIEQPLQFEQVKRLVERTVQIYRQQKPPSPAPQVRRSSFNRPPPPKISRPDEIDRNRTPKPGKTHPQLGRSTSSMPMPPLVPPPLDRSLSMPGNGPGPAPGFHNAPNPRPSNLHTPMPQGPYAGSVPHTPYSPQLQGPYSPQIYASPQAQPPYPSNASFNNPNLPPHLQPHNYGMQQSPLRQSYLSPNTRSRYDDDMTSESDSGKERRRRRSKSRSRYTAEPKKKSHNKSKAAGVLMGVGGLTALLDGLSGL